MKNLFTAKHLSLILLLSLLGGKVQADRSCDDGRCFRNEYECGCNPLNCGSFSLQFQAGVYPIVWTKRGDILINNPGTSAVTQITDLGQFPKFSKFYKTPWIVGGEIGYALSDNVNIYVEFNYAQAGGKDDGANTTAASTASASAGATTATAGAPLANLALKLEKYKLFSAYFGASYYFDRWCDRVSLFVGEKVGFVHHKGVDFTQLTANGSSVTTPASYTSTAFFNANTVISGGAHLGFDVCFCGNWALVLKGEVVASCGPKSRQNIVLASPDTTNLVVGGNNATNLLLGSVQTELSFPVTLGVKYNF